MLLLKTTDHLINKRVVDVCDKAALWSNGIENPSFHSVVGRSGAMQLKMGTAEVCDCHGIATDTSQRMGGKQPA
jgi:hypothetical protein